ncbi:myozenin-1 isoform X2 [Betta splendens]|uniref:Myozenin-1 isoform X2 n=1 Tax=Betta splendens TaxID=158456 RepID=A0A8M1H729_BETSP|nr:myozenin-1 isoform X2 [Betta splendens]
MTGPKQSHFSKTFESEAPHASPRPPYSPPPPSSLQFHAGAAPLVGFHSLRGEEEGRQFNTSGGTQIYLGIYNPPPLTRAPSGTRWDTWVLAMALTAPAPSNKRKKATKIITDLSNISQNDDESDSEAAELDLGTKIKTPKDVMLEELSLLKNKGSKMFKMRQQRVDMFIVTNENMNLQNLLMTPPPVPPKPEMPKEEGQVTVVEEETVDEEAEKERRRQEYVRTYVSPWERAMKDNEELKATMKLSMPGPIQNHLQLPQYKSFNRSATPFGGPDRAAKALTFELPEVGAAAEEPETPGGPQADVRSRPSFNRTPIGWVCSEDTSSIHIELDNVPFDGETDDL